MKSFHLIVDSIGMEDLIDRWILQDLCGFLLRDPWSDCMDQVKCAKDHSFMVSDQAEDSSKYMQNKNNILWGCLSLAASEFINGSY